MASDGDDVQMKLLNYEGRILDADLVRAGTENFPKFLARVSVSDVIEVDVDDDDRCNKIPVDLKAFRVALPSSSCGVTLANNRKEDKMALKEIK